MGQGGSTEPPPEAAVLPERAATFQDCEPFPLLPSVEKVLDRTARAAPHSLNVTPTTDEEAESDSCDAGESDGATSETDNGGPCDSDVVDGVNNFSADAVRGMATGECKSMYAAENEAAAADETEGAGEDDSAAEDTASGTVSGPVAGLKHVKNSLNAPPKSGCEGSATAGGVGCDNFHTVEADEIGGTFVRPEVGGCGSAGNGSKDTRAGLRKGPVGVEGGVEGGTRRVSAANGSSAALAAAAAGLSFGSLKAAPAPAVAASAAAAGASAGRAHFRATAHRPSVATSSSETFLKAFGQSSSELLRTELSLPESAKELKRRTMLSAMLTPISLVADNGGGSSDAGKGKGSREILGPASLSGVPAGGLRPMELGAGQTISGIGGGSGDGGGASGGGSPAGSSSNARREIGGPGSPTQTPPCPLITPVAEIIEALTRKAAAIAAAAEKPASSAEKPAPSEKAAFSADLTPAGASSEAATAAAGSGRSDGSAIDGSVADGATGARSSSAGGSAESLASDASAPAGVAPPAPLPTAADAVKIAKLLEDAKRLRLNRVSELTAAQIRLLPEKSEDLTVPSLGCVEHEFGTCRPCAFHNDPRKHECVNKTYCAFCHYTHEKRNKKLKQKAAQARAAAVAQQAAVTSADAAAALRLANNPSGVSTVDTATQFGSRHDSAASSSLMRGTSAASGGRCGVYRGPLPAFRGRGRRGVGLSPQLGPQELMLGHGGGGWGFAGAACGGAGGGGGGFFAGTAGFNGPPFAAPGFDGFDFGPGFANGGFAGFGAGGFGAGGFNASGFGPGCAGGHGPCGGCGCAGGGGGGGGGGGPFFGAANSSGFKTGSLEFQQALSSLLPVDDVAAMAAFWAAAAAGSSAAAGGASAGLTKAASAFFPPEAPDWDALGRRRNSRRDSQQSRGCPESRRSSHTLALPTFDAATSAIDNAGLFSGRGETPEFPRPPTSARDGTAARTAAGGGAEKSTASAADDSCDSPPALPPPPAAANPPSDMVLPPPVMFDNFGSPPPPPLQLPAAGAWTAPRPAPAPRGWMMDAPAFQRFLFESAQQQRRSPPAGLMHAPAAGALFPPMAPGPGARRYRSRRTEKRGGSDESPRGTPDRCLAATAAGFHAPAVGPAVGPVFL